ncbi:MAG TPA: hypothetical protein PKZ69_07335 [Candidatus Cloacimonadota bacterium]|nr:hypothetical protein [Candidatus Cloacimonadota bacterium]HOQ80020.1 hypothetical protein [Candidatus Cloacimonadota bacterium]HPK41422.1 hypothetical protein [Candidatus Cloacimonadota bacterium]
MTKLNKIIMICVICLSITALNAEKYAGEIFKMGAGIRNIALGRTGLADKQSSAKAYWNASLLAQQQSTDFELMHAEDFGGNLQYDILSANIGNQTNIGFVISRIAIDNISLTAIPNPDSLPSNDNRPFAYKKIANADYIINFGIGRQLNERLLIGFSPKFVYRNIAEENAFGFGADLSATYLMRDNIVFAGRLRDFFSTQLFYKNGSHEIVNPGVDLESAFGCIVPKLDKKATVYLNSEINFEQMTDAATISASAMSIDWHAGLELAVSQSISLYTGYDLDNITAGLTVNYQRFSINYSFEQDTELDNSHRISLGFKL